MPDKPREIACSIPISSFCSSLPRWSTELAGASRALRAVGVWPQWLWVLRADDWHVIGEGFGPARDVLGVHRGNQNPDRMVDHWGSLVCRGDWFPVATPLLALGCYRLYAYEPDRFCRSARAGRFCRPKDTSRSLFICTLRSQDLGSLCTWSPSEYSRMTCKTDIAHFCSTSKKRNKRKTRSDIRAHAAAVP